MEHYKWTERMSVGVSVIDEQHKKFFAMLNAIDNEVAKNPSGETAEALRGLVQYMQVHFQTEEDLMKERFFDQFPEHLAEHRNFALKIQEMLRKGREGKAVSTIEIRNFMADWLIRHIMACDMKYARFLAKGGNAL